MEGKGGSHEPPRSVVDGAHRHVTLSGELPFGATHPRRMRMRCAGEVAQGIHEVVAAKGASCKELGSYTRNPSHDAPRVYPAPAAAAARLRLRQDRLGRDTRPPVPSRSPSTTPRIAWHLLALLPETPGYDVQQPARHFTFVPFWGIAVRFVYAMRRVDCRTCGVTVEMAPWAAGKTHSTHAFVWFVASWARVLSWSEVARRFQSSWDTIFRCVEHAVRWGLANRNLDGIRSVGVDGSCWGRGIRDAAPSGPIRGQFAADSDGRVQTALNREVVGFDHPGSDARATCSRERFLR